MKYFNTIIIAAILSFIFSTSFSQTNNKAVFLNNNNYTENNQSFYFGSTNYNFTDKLTISVWVKWNALPDTSANNNVRYKWANIVTLANSSNNNVDLGQFWLQHSEKNSLFEIAVSASTRKYIYSKTTPVAGKWYFLTAVYNGSSPDTTLKFYVNGVLEGRALRSEVSGNITNYDSRFRMTAGRIPGGYRMFPGYMDELRIWKRALTQEEVINQMYSQQTINNSELASYYNFNTTEGSILNDLGPAHFDGKFYKEIVEIDSYSSSAPLTITNSAKNWTGSFAGLNVKTISGTGIDEINSVVSNTQNTIVLQNAFTTTPIINGLTHMTMLGIESSASENSMWVQSLAPLNNGSLDNLSELAGIWNAKASNNSSVFSLSSSNIVNDENVVFGHNNLDMIFSSAEVPQGANSRINRVWKIQTNKINGLTAKIEIDFSSLTVLKPEDLRLILSSSESFLNGTVLTGTISGSKFIINNATIPFGAYFTLGSMEAPLPVEMESFTYSVSQRNVILSWRTSKEINNSGFDIERKSETGNWNKIDFIKGNGNINSPVDYTYKDINLNSGKYQYRLRQVDYNGNFEYHNLTGDVIVGIPSKFELSQNYPNPFNPATKIDFSLPSESKVTIKIYDINGKELLTLVNEQRSAGYHTVNFNGSSFSSGTYFYQITATGIDGKTNNVAKKMILTK